MRRFFIFLTLGSLTLLVACSSSVPSGLPVSVSLTPSKQQTIKSGATLTITASVNNDFSNEGVSWSLSGAGTLKAETTTSVTYDAPSSVSSNTTVTVTATSKANSGATQQLKITVQPLAPISVSLEVAGSQVGPQTVAEAGTLALTAVLTNDLSGQGVNWSIVSGSGSLSNNTISSVTYAAPTTVIVNTFATIQATSIADNTAAATLEVAVVPSTSLTGKNVAPLTVGIGPVPSLNAALTSVAICVPQTTTCQTVDNILLDTGTVGLRILASAIPTLASSLPAETYSDGSQINECIRFMDGSYLWGGIVQADVRVANELAPSLPIQIAADPTGFSIPIKCTSNGAAEDKDSQANLAANGVLGVGPEAVDCGITCAANGGSTTPPSALYYASCTSSQGCQPVFVSCGPNLCQDATANQQMANLAYYLPVDNNGVMIKMPSLIAPALNASGSLVFGLGTESNNNILGQISLTLDSNDELTANFENQNLVDSFIDSTSDALFFPNWATPSLPICTTNTEFYCPVNNTFLFTSVTGANNSSNFVSFEVQNADTLLSSNPGDEAFNNLAGPKEATDPPTPCSPDGSSGDCTFDFGFPFFYEKSVFIAISGQSTQIGTGPYVAF